MVPVFSKAMGYVNPDANEGAADPQNISANNFYAMKLGADTLCNVLASYE